MSKPKRKVYLSGPMSGVERAEYVRRFEEAEVILRRHGYGVINPCRVWACRFQWMYRAMEWVLGKRLVYAACLCYDLLLLMTRADGIAMLPTRYQRTIGCSVSTPCTSVMGHTSTASGASMRQTIYLNNYRNYEQEKKEAQYRHD